MSELRRSLLKKRTPLGRTQSIAPDAETIEYQKKILFRLNAAEGFLHLASWIAALVVSIVFARQSYHTELRTDFLRYDVNNTAGPLNNTNPFSVDSRSLGFYALIWVDLPFPIITSLFHLFIAFHPSVKAYYYQQVFEYDCNPLRWAEYSITASLMYWVILQLSGVTNIFILIVVGVLMNVALQWQGYLQELLFKKKNYVPTVTGWIIFMGQWIVILAYFFAAVTSPRPPGAERPPWFVYSIVIGLFFQFCLFGLVQLSNVVKWPRFMQGTYAQEIAFSVLSLTTKLFLTWNLLIGVALNRIE